MDMAFYCVKKLISVIGSGVKCEKLILNITNVGFKRNDAFLMTGKLLKYDLIK